MRFDVITVDPAFPQHHVEHRVVEGDVGAGQEGEVEVGGFGGVGAAGVDDHQLHVRVGLPGVFDAAKGDRVREGGVAAGDEKGFGVGDVLVAAGRRVGAQAELVAGHRAGHAQARVGVEVVAADEAFHQLVEDVVILGEELAGAVDRDGVRAVLLDDCGESFGGGIERRVPAHALAGLVAAGAQFWVKGAGGLGFGGGRKVQGGALGAKTAEVGGVIGVALYAGDAACFMFDHNTAANAAVTTGGFCFGHVCSFDARFKQRACHVGMSGDIVFGVTTLGHD